MAAKPVYRLTLFKIPDEGSQDKLLELYRTMPQDALKVLFWKSKAMFRVGLCADRSAGRQAIHCLSQGREDRG